MYVSIYIVVLYLHMCACVFVIYIYIYTYSYHTYTHMHLLGFYSHTHTYTHHTHIDNIWSCELQCFKCMPFSFFRLPIFVFKLKKKKNKIKKTTKYELLRPIFLSLSHFHHSFSLSLSLFLFPPPGLLPLSDGWINNLIVPPSSAYGSWSCRTRPSSRW